MRAATIRMILLALNACDGVPMPEESLFAAVRLMAGHDKPTQSDFQDALKECESRTYVSGVTDDIAGRSWTLTTSGTHKARQLR